MIAHGITEDFMSTVQDALDEAWLASVSDMAVKPIGSDSTVERICGPYDAQTQTVASFAIDAPSEADADIAAKIVGLHLGRDLASFVKKEREAGRSTVRIARHPRAQVWTGGEYPKFVWVLHAKFEEAPCRSR